MSCCSGDEDDEQQPEPTRVRGCTDIFWLCCFIVFWFLMVCKSKFVVKFYFLRHGKLKMRHRNFM